MEQIVKKKLQGVTFNPQEINNWAKDIADETKVELRALNKDKRYKYMVQCTIGANIGQGVRIGSRQFWDEDTDDMSKARYNRGLDILGKLGRNDLALSIGKMYFVQFDGFEEKKYNLKEVVRAPQAL